MRQHPPWAASSDDVAQAVEEFAQGMITLRRILSHQTQIRCAKGPFLITDVAGINGSSLAGWAGWLLGHPQLMLVPCSGVQHFLSSKFITHSSRFIVEGFVDYHAVGLP